MKKFFYALLVTALVTFAACTNSSDETSMHESHMSDNGKMMNTMTMDCDMMQSMIKDTAHMNMMMNCMMDMMKNNSAMRQQMMNDPQMRKMMQEMMGNSMNTENH